jgi:hypothetical protein
LFTHDFETTSGVAILSLRTFRFPFPGILNSGGLLLFFKFWVEMKVLGHQVRIWLLLRK